MIGGGEQLSATESITTTGIARQDIRDAQARGQDAIRRMEEAMGIPTANIVPLDFQNRCAVVDAIGDGDAFAAAHGAADTRPVAQIQLPQPQLQQLGDLQPPQQEEEPTIKLKINATHWITTWTLDNLQNKYSLSIYLFQVTNPNNIIDIKTCLGI